MHEIQNNKNFHRLARSRSRRSRAFPRGHHRGQLRRYWRYRWDTCDYRFRWGLASTNYNNVTASSSATAIALNDDSGTASGATFTFSSGGNFAAGNATPVGGDEKLYRGYIFGDSSVTLSNIPYAHYDLYIYGMNDGPNRVEKTTLGTTDVFGSSPSPGNAGYIDGNGTTAFTFNRSVGTTSATATANGNYVLFSGLTGASQTFTGSAPGNGYLAGFQVVQIPEPSALGLVGFGFALALTRRSRK